MPSTIEPTLPSLEPAVLGTDIRVRLADGTRRTFANFDLAASAPCLQAVADEVAALLPYHASVHRGAGALSRRCTAAYELARQRVAAFLGCGPEHAVVFTRNTTDALNLLAHALPPGATVITFAGEHHANLLAWPAPVRLPLPAEPAGAVAAVEAALLRLPPDCRSTALVAVTGASNVTGELWPVRIIADVAHRYGARVVVDVAQLVPHRQVSIGSLGADWLAFSGHKLYAPFGAGVLAGRLDWLDAAPPYLRGGGATAHVGDAPGEVIWALGPQRHEAGTPNLLGAVAIGTACDTLAAADRAALAVRERDLLARLRRGLCGIAGVRELSLFGPDHPRVGIVAFTVAGVQAAEVARRLGDGYAIGVRAGQFCAHPLVRRLLSGTAPAGGSAPVAPAPGGPDGPVAAGATPGPPAAPAAAVRASFGLGTTAAQVDRLVEAVRAIAATPGRTIAATPGRTIAAAPGGAAPAPAGAGPGPDCGRVPAAWRAVPG